MDMVCFSSSDNLVVEAAVILLGAKTDGKQYV